MEVCVTLDVSGITSLGQELGFFPSSPACDTECRMQVLAGQVFSPGQYTLLLKPLHSSHGKKIQIGCHLLMVNGEYIMWLRCGCSPTISCCSQLSFITNINF